MKCQNCNREIPGDSDFCQYCGEKLVHNLVCPKCNKEIPPDSKFCPYCGKMKIHALKHIRIPHIRIKSKNIPRPIFVGDSQEKPTRKLINKYTVSIFFAMVLTCIIVVVVFILTSSDKSEDVPLSDYYTTTYHYTYSETTESQTTKMSYSELRSSIREESEKNEEATADYSSTTEEQTTRIAYKDNQYTLNKYSGTGDGNVKNINLTDGDYYFIFIYCGSDGYNYFDAYVYDGLNQSTKTSCSEFRNGSYASKVSGPFENGYINVSSDGDWEIVIEKCGSSESISSGETYTGEECYSIRNINLNEGKYYITFYCDEEESYVSGEAYIYDGINTGYKDSVSVLGNGSEVCMVDGPFKNGYINIESSGKWKLTIEPCNQ